MVIALAGQGDQMSDADNSAAGDISAPDDRGPQLRQVGAGFLRYVENNPLATVAGALIIGVILARFAFLGNPRD
jgi:hypothetical protein